LTLGSIRALRAADDVYFDEGVPAAVTDFARREARRYPVVKGHANSEPIRKALTVAARQGRRVVRLRLRTSADARGRGKEVRALREAGLSVVVGTPEPPS
jgi:uroporphyrin-III C-methyltransferase/precorrin-2 dehydrogenase/sirohydrochlorin ferrochelatase